MARKNANAMLAITAGTANCHVTQTLISTMIYVQRKHSVVMTTATGGQQLPSLTA